MISRTNFTDILKIQILEKPETRRSFDVRGWVAKAARVEWPIIALFFVILLALKSVVALWLYRDGYLEYDGDGFTRSLHAWEWMQQPRFEVDAWLPLQFWLNGTIMRVWSDLFFVPRVVNMLGTFITCISFFFIGRQLFGRVNGYLTALLVALFPWEIWFGMSGMADSLSNTFVSLGLLGFVRWLNNRRDRELLLASGGLLAASMLRYEAWFYALIYAGLVFLLAFRDKKFSVRLIPLVGLAFVFSVIWIAASWLQKGSPTAFISITSNLNANLEGRNREVGILGRLIFYPRTFFELMPRLVVPAVIGSVLLAWKPVGQVRWYLALVWGQLALFSISTLPTNNIAPGSQRYPVSNLLLLLPVVAWLLQFLVGWLQTERVKAAVQNFSRPLQVAAIGLFVLLMVSFVGQTLDRPNDFPNGDMRRLVLWLNDTVGRGTGKPGPSIPLYQPGSDQPNADYSFILGVQVLTNRPDGSRVGRPDIAGVRPLAQIKDIEQTVRDDLPYLWLHYDGPTTNEDDLASLSGEYLDNHRYGDYVASYRPRRAPLAVATTGQTADYTITGQGYQPGEEVACWNSWSPTDSRSLGSVYADTKGQITINFKAEVDGKQSVTARGKDSGRIGVANLEVSGQAGQSGGK